MFRLALLASLMTGIGCRISLESKTDNSTIDAPISQKCLEATTHSDLTFLEDGIFKTGCTFSGCHNGGPDDAGKQDLRSGMAFSHLVNVPSRFGHITGQPETAHPLTVVPMHPEQSFLLVMLGQIAPEDAVPPVDPPPADIGFMPQNSGGLLICQQKRDAIVRWIMAGALDN